MAKLPLGPYRMLSLLGSCFFSPRSTLSAPREIVTFRSNILHCNAPTNQPRLTCWSNSLANRGVIAVSLSASPRA